MWFVATLAADTLDELRAMLLTGAHAHRDGDQRWLSAAWPGDTRSMLDQPSRYAAEYAAWQADPVGWWERQAGALQWDRPWDRGFDPALGVFGQYFAGGALNVSANCLDRHVASGRGGQTALIYDSPMAACCASF